MEDERNLIECFFRKYGVTAKSISVMPHLLWERATCRFRELPLEVSIAFDSGRVIIEKGTLDELIAIAEQPVAEV